MTRTFHRRPVAAVAGLLVVVMSIAGVGGWLLGVRAMRDAAAERLRIELGLVEEGTGRARSPDELEQTLRRAASRLGVRLMLIDADRRVLADSHGQGGRRSVPADEAPELEQAARVGWGSSEHRSRGSGVSYLFVARRIDGPDGPRYLRAALREDELAVPARRLAGSIALLDGVLLAAALAFLAFFAGRMRRPLEAARQAAQALAEGRLADRLPGADFSEPDSLPSLLEAARDRLQRRIERFERRYHNLALVVSGMKEALVLVDRDRRIELVNEAFRALASPRVDPVGRTLTEVLRDPEAVSVIEDVLEHGRDRRLLTRRRSADRRAWELIVYPLPGERDADPPAGAVALFLDVSRLERLEQTRRDFIANVSHELRTPLTSLKAAAMTLADGAAEDPAVRERFLATIVRQVDRMTELVSDLGDLSRIETGAVKLQPENVAVEPLVGEVVHQVRLRRPDAEVTIGIEVPDGFRVHADRGRLEQILVNLVDNAVKFNRPGGRVTIRGVRPEGGGATLVVEDTGVGIAADDQAKVFSRFYRVDPSRSRELGGTGLGLAIVKHLMALHGGRVRLESELGRGSRFILEFPPDGSAGESSQPDRS